MDFIASGLDLCTLAWCVCIDLPLSLPIRFLSLCISAFYSLLTHVCFKAFPLFMDEVKCITQCTESIIKMTLRCKTFGQQTIIENAVRSQRLLANFALP